MTSDEGIWYSSFFIHIYPAEIPTLPILIYNTHAFNPAGDNDNGIAEGGESIGLLVDVFNSGNANASNVSAVLTCTDPDIFITDDAANYPDIVFGGHEWCTSDFDFDIDPNCIEKDVEFILEITSDEGVWLSPFLVHIYAYTPTAPVLAYFNHEIDDTDSNESDGDGIPEAGEAIQLPLSIFNYGTGDAQNVSATLHCNDPFITIIDNSENFGGIDAGEEGWSNYSYDFEIAANCPAKDAMFMLEITSDEGVWTSYFAISIASPNSPDLTYPNPSNGVFKLLSTSIGGYFNYQLIDISGNQISDGEVFVGIGEEPVLNYGWLDTGIYFLRLNNGTETRMQKLIIR